MEMNPVVHFEMPVSGTNRKKTVEFYTKTFGWKAEQMGPEMGNYVVVSTTENGEDGRPKMPGAINGGFFPKTDAPQMQKPNIVIAVDDIKEHVKKVNKAGGKVQGDPMEIPGVGLYVSFLDTDGNRLCMLQPIMKFKSITVGASINTPVEKVWELWTEPKHITKWNNASDDWHSPSAENNVKVNGKFKIRMEAKNKSAGFDFEGTYTAIEKYKLIEYKMADGRKVKVVFEKAGKGTKVTETFDMEHENSEELQRKGWQSILNNFKKYTEKGFSK